MPSACCWSAIGCSRDASISLLVQSTADKVDVLSAALLETRNADRLPTKKELAEGAKPDDRFDALTPKRSLLVECLAEICHARPRDSLQHLGPSVWKSLIKWCEEHPESNIFHTSANRLFVMLIQKADEAMQKNILQKSKILSRFASLALPVLRKEERITSSFFGFVLLDVSLVILEAMKRGPDSYLYAIVAHTPPWPELRDLCMSRASLLGNWRNWNDINLPPLS